MAHSASELHAMSRRELMAVLRSGYAIDEHALDDLEYRGTSLGLPGFVERLTWKKFKKVFHRDPETGALRGWNVRLMQNALDEPCVPMTKNGRARAFGFYRVVSPAGYRVPKGCDRGLLIHYGLGGNGAFDPMGRARDPLVAVREGDPTLLLGWTYLDVGVLLGTPSFFTLELDGPLAERLASPR